jgi:hypothetical protein
MGSPRTGGVNTKPLIGSIRSIETMPTPWASLAAGCPPGSQEKVKMILRSVPWHLDALSPSLVALLGLIGPIRGVMLTHRI